MTRVLVNGHEGGHIDPGDRGFQYGDGLFETIAVPAGRPRFLEWHLERLAAGARRLRIALPDESLLRREIAAVCPAGRGIVKLIVSRGPGPRGYRPTAQARPTRVVACHPWGALPDARAQGGLRVGWCRMRLGRNPALAGIKHLNRLEQVLARAEWDDAALDEGLMQDDRDLVISATQANVFARIDGHWMTPRLDRCGVAGIMRRAFLAWLERERRPAEERELPATELRSAESLVLTNALIGACPVGELDGRRLAPADDLAGFDAWLAAQ